MINKECYEAVCSHLKKDCLKYGESIVSGIMGLNSSEEDLNKFSSSLIHDALKKLEHQGYLSINPSGTFKITDFGYNFFTNFK